jgi:hypothetical protein
MDAERLDHLARTLATTSRRGALRLLAGSALARAIPARCPETGTAGAITGGRHAAVWW